MLIHDPGNHLPPITRLYAVVSVDANGKEGLCNLSLGGTEMPLVFADPANIARLRPFIEQLAKTSSKRLVLIELTRSRDIEEFRP